jgi:hypothetical protein
MCMARNTSAVMAQRVPGPAQLAIDAAADWVPAKRGGYHRDRHSRYVQVGPLLGGQVETPAKPSHQTPTPPQLRRSVIGPNTLCENKSHDLLLPEARPVCTPVVGRMQSSLKLRRRTECRNRIGTKRISNTDKGYRSGSFRLTSSRPVHMRVHNGAQQGMTMRPSRQSFGIARRIRTFRPEATLAQPLTGRT